METSETFYAHTHPDHPDSAEAAIHWERLYTGCETKSCDGLGQCCSKCGHLDRVARLSAKFAEEMFPPGSEDAKAAREWGWLTGLWHDIGKFAPEFQRRIGASDGAAAHIEEVLGRVDHSTAGAVWGMEFLPAAQARIIAYVIAGHHGGLPNFRRSDGPAGGRNLAARLESPPSESAKARKQAACHLGVERLEPPLPIRLDKANMERACFDLAFFARMLFSSLVDADRLCTEAFCDPDQACSRKGGSVPLETMRAVLDSYLRELTATAEPSAVNEIRTRILRDCEAAANKRAGLFTLTVPTGGGKTLSSLAFALKHATENPSHKMRRIVYVVPFTSIIEQNADKYRQVFSSLGSDIVLEHHCNLDTEAWEKDPVARLRTENWDAPLIVTTAVQFYESLFSAKTRRTRRLHNLARSVIILDEAQTIPVQFLQPCLWALETLAKDYGATVVFCTATQPNLQRSEDFPIGLDCHEVEEIIDQPERLYGDLKRVEVTKLGSVDDAELANRLNEERQMLCIVNTRRHAAALFDLLQGGPEGNFHLSTRMCPMHRRTCLDAIRYRLKTGQSCRVISTSLVEAGVDVDFPVVYRCIAGLDSIAQAAGRCNREGRLQAGRVSVFESSSENAKVHPEMAKPIESSRLTLPRFDDPLSLDAISEYFKQHYSKFQSSEGSWDAKDVLDKSRQSYGKGGLEMQFREIESAFRLIPEEQTPVIVPYGDEGSALWEHWIGAREFPGPRDLRALQQYSVQLRDSELETLQGDVFQHPVVDSLRFLVNRDLYDEKRGLLVRQAGQWNPEALVI